MIPRPHRLPARRPPEPAPVCADRPTRSAASSGAPSSTSRVRAALAAVAMVSAMLGAGSVFGTGVAAGEGVVGESCELGEGVTVVVDFGDLGGVKVGCAVGAQTSGFAALAAAGFSVGFEGGPGMVCTLDGLPVEGFPYCWSTGGYWSYWKKARGGVWAYSPAGAGSGPLAVDSVEGWSWAGGFESSAPEADESTAPPQATTTTTETTTTETTAPTATDPTATSSSTPGPAPSTSDPVSTTTSPTTTRPGSSTGPSSSVPAGSRATSSPGSSPGSVGSAGGSPRSPLPRTGTDPRLPAAVAVALALAGAALIVAGRRYRLATA